MKKFRHVLITALALAALLQGCVIQDRDDWVNCGRDRLRVVDLDMSPDPVAVGERLERFRVSLRSDGSSDCAIQLQIRETQGNDVIASERVYRLRPGMNRINVEPEGRYRFSRQEHCFNVVVNVENNWRPVDAARRFCVRQVGDRRWSLRS
jgi:hypothetical protein